MVPSKFQQDIYDWAERGTGNALVAAVAGSGKTYTLEQLAKMINGEALFLAFNKSITVELGNRLGDVEVRTMNSFGASLITRCKLDKNKSKNFIMTLFDDDWNKAIKHVKVVPQLISLMKAYAFGVDVNAQDLKDLADKFGLEIPDWSIVSQTWVHHCALKPKTIDFDDQIWRPVIFGASPKHYDWVMVDECQDLNPIMIELLKLVSGRKVFVGDEAQAIYGFRGADEHAIDNIKSHFNCTILPLSVCYRCGSEIVRVAQEIIPEIDWHWEGGLVVTQDIDEIDPQSGDLVICRVTKDLVIGCLNMIRDGKSATIKGREIGMGLKKVYKDSRCDGDLDRLEQWANSKRFKSKDQQLAFDDKVDTLVALIEFGDDVIDTIDLLFSEYVKGTVFSTIHKAKGLEADRVFIIRPDLLPHPLAKGEAALIQERNLKYVAITRAKKELIFVNGEYR